jgi:hypothetical protein
MLFRPLRATDWKCPNSNARRGCRTQPGVQAFVVVLGPLMAKKPSSTTDEEDGDVTLNRYQGNPGLCFFGDFGLRTGNLMPKAFQNRTKPDGFFPTVRQVVKIVAATCRAHFGYDQDLPVICAIGV